MTKPKYGDRVRVTPRPFEGVLTCDGSQGRLVRVRDETGRAHAFGSGYASVEVIQPADDPSKDPVGTVRRSSDGRVAQRADDSSCPWQEYIDEFTDCAWHFHKDVVGWDIIGAVPGTPAWDIWRKGELRGAPEFPPHTDIREPWTGYGSEEPPPYVHKIRDKDGDEIERRGNGWAFLTVYGRVIENPVQSTWNDLDPVPPLFEVID